MAPTEAARVADARRRRDALRERLIAERLDCAIVSNEGNFSYLTGYDTPSWANHSRPIALVVPAEGADRPILTEAEVERILEWDPELEPAGYAEPSASLGSAAGPDYVAAAVDAVAAAIGRAGTAIAIERSGTSAPGLPPDATEAIGARLGVDLVDLNALIWPLRLHKSDVELECLEESARTLARSFEDFAQRAALGMTERELQAEFAAAAAQSGADRIAYVVVVAGAERPLLGPPTDRAWGEGELLGVDAGVVTGGYWADYCRFYAAASSTPPQERAYARLVGAVEAGRDAAASGSRAGAPAEAMASALERESARFGRFGHGIGLDLAEPPSLHAEDPTVLERGMTVCVEPSAWFEDVGHLVAEEMVAIGDGRGELLSPRFPAELEVVPA